MYLLQTYLVYQNCTMAEVNLTQEIANEGEQKGYIDGVVAEIKAIEAGEDLVMPHTCIGGDIFQGDRLNRAVLEHPGHTKAIVIGLAASMGGVNLSAFDEVELDEDCNVMLHKARIPELPIDEYTAEQTQTCNDFNRRAYSRLIKKGMDKDLLDEIFLSDETKDFWFTAKEAEAAGLGHVTKIERRNSQPFKVAAKIDLDSIKNQYKNMSIFSNKTKAVNRVAKLADGRQVAFVSEDEEIKKGTVLALIGSSDSLEGKIRLSDTLEAEIDSSNQVTDIHEDEAPEETEDQKKIKELEAQIASLEEKAKAQFGEEEEEDEEKKKAEAKAALEAEANVKDAKEISDILTGAKNVLANLKTVAKLYAPDDKHEEVMSNLSESEKHIQKMHSVRNNLKTEKVK